MEPNSVLDPHLKLALQFASDLSKQLITLSTGIIVITITFTKDILKRVSLNKQGLLGWAWAIYLISVIFGIFSLMSLTGVLAPKDGEPLKQISCSARVNSAIQIITFLVATFMVILYGIVELRAAKNKTGNKHLDPNC
jgi:hypothetical protein